MKSFPITLIGNPDHKTKQALDEILSHFTRTTGEVTETLPGKPYLLIETDHGKAQQIGQFALRRFPEVRTYFACHVFRKARLSIYFHQ